MKKLLWLLTVLLIFSNVTVVCAADDLSDEQDASLLEYEQYSSAVVDTNAEVLDVAEPATYAYDETTEQGFVQETMRYEDTQVMLEEKAPKIKKEKKHMHSAEMPLGEVKKEEAPKVKEEKKTKKHKKIKKTKEEKRLEEEKEKQASAARAEARRLKKAHKIHRGNEKQLTARKRREYKHDLAAASEKARREEWYLAVRDERVERKALMAKWNALYALERDRDTAAGKQAYLYKEPAWPVSALFFEGKKDLLSVNATYKYATDSFCSSGASGDITRLAFGEAPITVQDILLASKLVKATTVVQDDQIATTNTSYDNYLKYLAQELITFNGRSEQYSTSIDFSRYIVNHDVTVGFELPVVYKKNYLKMESILSNAAISPNNTAGNPTPDDGAFGPRNGAWANIFLRRYGADPVRFLTDALRAKGINELGGSAMGLGDVAIFVNGQFNSVRYDKLVLGLRVLFPTGKKASTSKLWAPDLGNGGFSEIAAYSSILFSYKKYLNPHAMGTVSFSMPANVDRRVPRRIVLAAPAGPVGKLNLALDADHQIAFADRVNTVVGSAIDAHDTTIKNFADKATRVRLTKGAEFKFRLGNMFERFISAVGFMDLFYDFRGKLRDSASGLSKDLYNIDTLTQGTAEIEHRIGLAYSHQYDLYTRLRIGASYTFAGMNVPKTFELDGSINYAF